MKNKLCLSLTENTLDKNIKTVEMNKEYTDLLELRADFLEKEQLKYLYKFPEMTELPVILTIRRRKEGGKFIRTENERIAHFNKALSGPGRQFSFIDLENDFDNVELEKQIINKKIRIIRSIHDYSCVPDNLKQLLIKKYPDEILKAALTPNSTRELIKAIELFKELDSKEKILTCMGSFGFITRILSPVLGSYLSYSSSDNGSKAAPGHISPEKMQTLYRYRNISSNTKIFGVIGNPVMHSFSPAIHNRGFSELNMDAVYVPMHIDNIRDFFTLQKMINIQGVSITIPHKQAIIPHIKKLDESVLNIGACNTLYKDPESGWTGYNSDAWGFYEPINTIFEGKSLNGKKATVIGAGGASRAIVYILRKHGASLLILNRTEKKAEMLAKEFSCEWGGLNPESISGIKDFNDIIVQTTNSGMHPDTGSDPLKEYKFSGKEIFYEIIYNPPVTKLMQRAIDAGCRTIYGREMLINQAVKQFLLFTGEQFPCKDDILKEFEKY